MNRYFMSAVTVLGLTAMPVAQAQDSWPSIRPAEWPQQEVKLELGGNVQDVAVGAAGCILILKIEGRQELVVVDLLTGKRAGAVPCSWPETRFAAGLNSLILLDAETGKAELWSLETLTREAEGTIDVTLPIGAVAMGSASIGPLFVIPRGCRWPLDEVVLIDPQTFQRAVGELELEGRNVRQFLDPDERQTATASANGLLFHTAPTQFVVRFHGATAAATYYRTTGNQQAVLLPDFSGEVFFGPGQPLSQDFRPVPGTNEPSPGTLTVPDHHGPFYMRFELQDALVKSATVHLAGAPQPGVALPPLALSAVNENDAMPLWKRVHLVSAAHLIAVCDPQQSVLRLIRFDPEQALAQTRREHLAVLSQPVAIARTGQRFSYVMKTLSSESDVRFEPEQAPKNAAVSSSGEVTWEVPTESATPLAKFAIKVRSGDLVTRHRFTVRVLGAEPANARPVAVVKQPPIGDTMHIEPPELPRTPTILQLRSTVSEAAVGGGGRFIVLKLVGELAVFDVNSAAVIGHIPLSSTRCLVAAGAESLIIVDPVSSKIERWSLADLSFDKSVQLRFDQPVSRLMMGSATNGPVVVGLGEPPAQLRLVDAETLQVLNQPPLDLTMRFNAPDQVRISADGRLISSWYSSSSPLGVQLLVRRGELYDRRSDTFTCGSLLPTPDSRYVLTPAGAFTNRIRPAGFGEPGKFMVPALRGPYYLSIEMPQRLGRTSPGNFALHVIGETQPVAELPALASVLNEIRWERPEQMDLGRRLWFIPDANIVAALTGVGNRLVLYRVDVDALLNAAPRGYLFVISAPPRETRAGDTWSYHLRVASNAGGLQFRLPVGPQGMAIDGFGHITWRVPASAAPGDRRVIAAINDRSGREVLHAFDIHVSN